MFLGGNNAADVPANAHTRAFALLPPDARPQYVAYPPPDSPEVSRYMAKCCTQRAWARGDQNVAFIGQVPRLLPLQYIPWALDLLLEEYGTRWVLQTQPNGCAKAWVDDVRHCNTLATLSKTMLFDVCGVWVARTRPQIDASMAYQATLQSQGPPDRRLLRHGVVAEKLQPPIPRAPTSARWLPHRPQIVNGFSMVARSDPIDGFARSFAMDAQWDEFVTTNSSGESRVPREPGELPHAVACRHAFFGIDAKASSATITGDHECRMGGAGGHVSVGAPRSGPTTSPFAKAEDVSTGNSHARSLTNKLQLLAPPR